MVSKTPFIQGLLALVTVVAIAAMPASAIELTEDRLDLEAGLDGLRAAYELAPGDVEARRAYATALFKLGNQWQANDVIAPLASASSSNTDDLKLAGYIALLTMQLERAEVLLRRLLDLSDPGTEERAAALYGLTLTYYQQGAFHKAGSLEVTPREKGLKGMKSAKTMIEFMQRFKGQPYQLQWTAADKVAHLPFTNPNWKDGGQLPEVEVTVNGTPLTLTLDTGGDRLYLDVSAVEKVGMLELTVTKAKYAYTKGKEIDEPWGVVDTVELGGVTLRNVPAVKAQWRANGPTTDGVVGTAILKQFLSTIDYENAEITLRPRGQKGLDMFHKAMGNRELVQMPYYMASTHLMFAKGQVNGHQGLNMFLDSGLGASMPMILVDETVEILGLEKHDIEGTPYYWSQMDSHGLDDMKAGSAQALGNVFVEGDNYRQLGFFWDALISHQYLWKFGAWTIDFDNMSYYFPVTSELNRPVDASNEEATAEKIELQNTAPYVGDYSVANGAAILKISAKGNTLYLQAPGQQPVSMEAYADGTFGIPLAAAKIEFEGNPASGVTAMKLIQGSNVTRGVKQ